MTLRNMLFVCLVVLLNVLLGECWIIKPAAKCHDCNPQECTKITHTAVCHEKRISTYCPLSCGLCSDTKPLGHYLGCYVSKSECDTINPYYCFSSVVWKTCPDLCNSQKTNASTTPKPHTPEVTTHLLPLETSPEVTQAIFPLETSPEVVKPEVTQAIFQLETSPEDVTPEVTQALFPFETSPEVATVQEEIISTSESDLITSDVPEELTDTPTTDDNLDQFMTSPEPSAFGSTDSTVKRICHVCEDPFCNLHFETIVECPEWQPYCMNYIAINVQGKKSLHKRCVSEVECDFKWINRTADISECLLFDNNKIYTQPIHCEFCCTEDNCNRNTVPKYSTLKLIPTA